MLNIFLEGLGKSSENNGGRSLNEVKVKIEVQEEDDQPTGGDESGMGELNQEERIDAIMQQDGDALTSVKNQPVSEKDDEPETEEFSQVKVEGDRQEDMDTPYGENQPEFEETMAEENDEQSDESLKWNLGVRSTLCVIS